MICTHNSMLFIFPIITHKMAQIANPLKQGTSRSLHDHEQFFVPFINKLQRYRKTKQNPKTSVPGLKPNLNTIRKCSKIVPKILSKMSKNSPKNSARTVRKQSRKFSPYYLKTIPKISKHSYTQSQIVGLKFTASKKIPSH